jgi:threonine aldolase
VTTRIDLRTESGIRPPDHIMEAMLRAPVTRADDREDPSVRELEGLVADLTGQEAGLFVPTGTLANHLSVTALCPPGGQLIMDRYAHLWWAEDLNFARLGGIGAVMLEGPKGELPPQRVREELLECGHGLRPSRSLIAIENTHNLSGGTVRTPAYVQELVSLAREMQSSIFCDGARLWHAAAALGCELRDLSCDLDAVTLALNKGLGAPYGAVVCANRQTIEAVWRGLRHFGAHSVHKAGIFAAAAVEAITTMRERLPEDHRRAKLLAAGCAEIPGLQVDSHEVQTNIVRIDCAEGLDPLAIIHQLAREGIGATQATRSSLRFVTHFRVTDEQVHEAVHGLHRVMDRMLS